MSGLIDLSGIAARAYTPDVKSAQTASRKSETPEDNRPIRPVIADRRLAPAFSIELSLAAQLVLDKAGEQQPAPVAGKAALQNAPVPTLHSQFSEGVGRREAPLAGDQRTVALGSRLNIEI